MNSITAARAPADWHSGGADALLGVDNLVVRYAAGRKGLWGRRVVEAVAGVSFDVLNGEVFGLVGESGCGKSSVAKAVLNVQPPSAGSVRFAGHDLGSLAEPAWRRLRREIQYVFQDPLGALDPRMAILEQVREPLVVHGIGDAAGRWARAAELLQEVGLDADSAAKYPHELSGGQRQRAVIARALIMEPRLLICDEPVSALDVSIQAQVVELLERLRRALGLTILFISHDLSLVRYLCDRVAVMYLGRIVEIGPVDRVFDAPAHPYTKALLAAVPIPDPGRRLAPPPLRGEPPSAFSPPRGCRFHPRCPAAKPLCAAETPTLEQLGPGHAAACHFANERR